jgi:hypothetical protein
MSLFGGISEQQMLAALEMALNARTSDAASIFTPPSNSRAYSCAAHGCQRPAYAKGLCNAHYLRKRKGLSMLAPVRASKREGECAQCGKKTGSKGGWGLCPSHYRKARYEALKDAAIAALGGECARCKGSFHRAVFDFHHRGEKQDSPSAMFLNSSVEALAKELSKCILLCANCHRLEHVEGQRQGKVA